MIKRKVLLLATILAVAVPATVVAATTSGTSALSARQLREADARARAFWAHPDQPGLRAHPEAPCGGAYQISVAAAGQDLPAPPGPHLYGQSPPGACYIKLARWKFGAGKTSFKLLCQVVTHEMGHLLRLQFPENKKDTYHSANPSNVMYSNSTPLNTPKICLQAFS